MVFLRVYLIRHGQSSNNVLAATSASSYNQKRTADAWLTELGQRQAVATGLFLKHTAGSQDVPLKQVYSSAMSRALGTASLLSGPLGLRPRVFPDICEIGGIFDNVYSEDGAEVVGTKGVAGMSASEVRAQFPLAVLPDDGSITEAGWWSHASKETEEEGVERVRRVLRELLAAALALQRFDGTNDEELETNFDVRARLRKAPTPLSSSPAVGGSGVGEGVPEGFDAPGAVDDSARRFHGGAGTTEDARMSGGEVRAALKYTRDGRPKLSGGRAAKVGLEGSSSSGPGPRSIAVALVAHGDFIETMLRAIATLDAETASKMAQKYEEKSTSFASPTAGEATESSSSSSERSSRSSLSLLHHNPLAATQFAHHNAGITAFDIFGDGNIRLLRVNDTSHLLFHGAVNRMAAGKGKGEGEGEAAAPIFSTELLTGGPGL